MRNHRKPFRLAVSILAGRRCLKRIIFPFRVAFINEQNRRQDNSFVQSHFDHNIILTTFEGGELKPILHTTLATLRSQLETWGTSPKSSIIS